MMMPSCTTINSCSSHSQVSASPTPSDTLSIRQIARLYAGEQILVSPISWTSRQVELLRCSFNDPAIAPSNTKLDYSPEQDGYVYVKGYLRSWMKYTYRRNNIQRLLTAPECPLTSSRSSIALHFDRISKKLPCTLFSYQNGETTSMVPGQPVAAYVDLGELEQRRVDTLQCYRPTRYSPLCNTIWQNRWEKLNPPEPLYDPYIVALLIAVAQEKRNHMHKASFTPTSQEKFYLSQVLCSFRSKDHLRLYTANISTSLLEMFDDSSVAPPTPVYTPIAIHEVPISPEHTLRARLIGLLCATYLPQKAKRKLDDEPTILSPPAKIGRIDSD